MPKHKFDGSWNYFEMPDTTLGLPADGDDLILVIPEEDGNVDVERSRHGPHRVDGQAFNRRVELTRLETGNTRKLHGRVIMEFMVGEVRHIVIAGRFKDEDERGLTQNEGTWIVTKP